MSRRPPRIGTRRLLITQSVVLTLLTLLACAALFATYQDVHRRPAEVRDRTAPAVLEVAAARASLMNAHLAAGRSLRSGVGDVVGPGEDYRAQIAAATQSLSRTADRQVAGEYGEQRLSTINALLLAYTDAIARAAQRESDSVLVIAEFLIADALLNREGTGILSRLDELQDAQRDVLLDQTTFRGGRWTLWWPAGAVFAVLAVALTVAQVQLGRRFPQRLNPALLAAGALLVACWTAVPLAAETQQRLAAARGGLLEVIGQQRDVTAEETLTDARLNATRKLMTSVRDGVNSGMDDTDWRTRAGLALPLGGLAAALLITTGLQRHLVQYRIRR